MNHRSYPSHRSPPRSLRSLRLTSEAQFTQIEIACDLVCTAFAVSFEEIIGRCRRWDILWPRFVLINLLLRNCAGLSMYRLGPILDRDEATIINARQAFANELETNPAARARYQLLEQHFLRRINKPKLAATLVAHNKPV